jgi:hypothetical protein
MMARKSRFEDEQIKRTYALVSEQQGAKQIRRERRLNGAEGSRVRERKSRV